MDNVSCISIDKDLIKFAQIKGGKARLVHICQKFEFHVLFIYLPIFLTFFRDLCLWMLENSKPFKCVHYVITQGSTTETNQLTEPSLKATPTNVVDAVLPKWAAKNSWNTFKITFSKSFHVTHVVKDFLTKNLSTTIFTVSMARVKTKYFNVLTKIVLLKPNIPNR